MKIKSNHTKNELKGNKNEEFRINNQIKLNHNSTFYFLVIILLFVESVYILLSIVSKGILKKEILTKKSTVGFDIIIKN